MSLTDGGAYKCDDRSHSKKTFTTADPVEWANHRADGKHTDSGSSTCVICGNQTTFDHKKSTQKAVCEKCKEDLK